MLTRFEAFSVPIFMTPIVWKNKDKVINETIKHFEEVTQVVGLEGGDEYNELKEIILSFKSEIFDLLGFDETELEMSRLWINRFVKDEFIKPHWHPNSWLSGVYYPYGSNGSPITFLSPLPCPTIAPNVKKSNAYNNEQMDYNFSGESMIIFPSYLRHYTTPVQDSNNRISIAFNLWPKGTLQSDAISKVTL